MEKLRETKKKAKGAPYSMDTHGYHDNKFHKREPRQPKLRAGDVRRVRLAQPLRPLTRETKKIPICRIASVPIGMDNNILNQI